MTAAHLRPRRARTAAASILAKLCWGLGLAILYSNASSSLAFFFPVDAPSTTKRSSKPSSKGPSKPSSKGLSRSSGVEKKGRSRKASKKFFGVDTSTYDSTVLRPMLKRIEGTFAKAKLNSLIGKTLGKDASAGDVEYFRTKTRSGWDVLAQVPALSKQFFPGSGRTPKEAEQSAAIAALRALPKIIEKTTKEKMEQTKKAKDVKVLEGVQYFSSKVKTGWEVIARVPASDKMFMGFGPTRRQAEDKAAQAVLEGMKKTKKMAKDNEFLANGKELAAKHAVTHLEALQAAGKLAKKSATKRKLPRNRGVRYRQNRENYHQLLEIIDAKNGELTVDFQEAAELLEAVVKIDGLGDSSLQFQASGVSKSQAKEKAIASALETVTKL